MPSSKSSDGPVWCEEKQIYLGGVPENEEVQRLIEEGDGHVRIFGYGSLCWNPGADGVLRRATQTLGSVKGYKRVWAQRSTDHRGTVEFPGIVCTLLKEAEYVSMNPDYSDWVSVDSEVGQEEKFSPPVVTQGVIFDVPPELVQETLAELDFRERGGYARDVCEVTENESEHTYKVLCYRGTPDNPAFSSRYLLDLPLSAAIMSVSRGPSGPNDVYLNNLNTFLGTTESTMTIHHDDTKTLAGMVKYFQNNYKLYFLSGGGSNQHDQLLLNRPTIPSLVVADDAHVRTDFVLPTRLISGLNSPRTSFPPDDVPREIYAGGGHSGLLTKSGRLFLWGWNGDLQCGMTTIEKSNASNDEPLAYIEPLQDIIIERASLGFSHTLVVEKQTGRVYAFGNDERGQVSGCEAINISDASRHPMTPKFLEGEAVVVVKAGLYHSAVVTKAGYLFTFGCDRFGQSNISDLSTKGSASSENQSYSRWKPSDADRIIDVATGRRHTVAIDSLNRIWTFGENKHGQLGRPTEKKKCGAPGVVDMVGKIGEKDTVNVYCGWSHTIIHVESVEGSKVYGFGRNDKGQLGNGSNLQADRPMEIFTNKEIKSVRCGSESTMVIDREGRIWGCGWNEHGNLGTGDQEDKLTLTPNQGVKICSQPGICNPETLLAVGGAHYIVATVEKT